MPRYIDADAINMSDISPVDGFSVFGATAEDIELTPTADVQPVIHAQWLGTENDGYADGFPVYIAWKCSNCGAEFECEDMDFHYCPNCGAKMESEDKDG